MTGHQYFLHPKGWQLTEQHDAGCAYYNRTNRLAVIVSVLEYSDQRFWLHVSLSRADRTPDFSDLARIKKDFVGADRKAIMVFPKADEHVNLHPFCLHLYACLDGDPLPDFRHALALPDGETLYDL